MRKRVVVFDTETTGLSPADEICQIAAVEYSNGNPSATLNFYLAPTCEISKEAEGVHGLSAEFLATHGMDPAEAMKQFLRFVGDDVRLVAPRMRKIRATSGEHRSGVLRYFAGGEADDAGFEVLFARHDH